MTSSTHDDRIEVLSVAGVAVGSSTGALIGGSSRGRASGYGAHSLGLVSPITGDECTGGAVGGAMEAEEGAIGAVGGVGVTPGPSERAPKSGGGGGAGSGGGTGAGGGSARRGSSATGGSGHSGRRSSTRHGSIHSSHHRPSTHGDARRGRGYTYLVPSPEDPYRTMAPIPPKEPKTESQKRIARIVMVLASLMLIMSLLLVGVTLSMSDHIDEMVTTTETNDADTTVAVRKMNGLSTTTTTPTARSSPQTLPTAAQQGNISSSASQTTKL